jgi:hypothetical protein
MPPSSHHRQYVRVGGSRLFAGLLVSSSCRGVMIAAGAGMTGGHGVWYASRSTTPSAQVVAALARVLQLTDSERDHLYRLVGLVPPSGAEISDHIPPGLRRLLNRLGDATAAAGFAVDWQMIWRNRAWVALLGDPSSTRRRRDSAVTARTAAGVSAPRGQRSLGDEARSGDGLVGVNRVGDVGDAIADVRRQRVWYGGRSLHPRADAEADVVRLSDRH